MSLILAIETSTDSGSIAVSADSVCTERTAPAGTPHSTWLLPAITALLAQRGIALRDLDAIAYGTGPGSFTGLRLACGVAQGLALGLSVPVIGVCSLESLALATGAQRAWVGVDARMSEMYYAGYQIVDGEVHTLIAPACAAPELVPEPQGDDWTAAGSAFAAYGEILVPRISPHCRSIDPLLGPTAGLIAQIALGRLTRGEVCDPALAAPLYVRDKVALTTAERLARGGRV